MELSTGDWTDSPHVTNAVKGMEIAVMIAIKNGTAILVYLTYFLPWSSGYYIVWHEIVFYLDVQSLKRKAKA